MVLGQAGVGLVALSARSACQQVLAGVLGRGVLGDGGPVGVLGAGGGQAVGQVGQLQAGVADRCRCSRSA